MEPHLERKKKRPLEPRERCRPAVRHEQKRKAERAVTKGSWVNVSLGKRGEKEKTA